MKATVLQGQSLLDIAVQTCGSVEAAFDLAVANNLDIDDKLIAGQELDAVSTTDTQIVNYYKNRNIKPATSATGERERTFDNSFDGTFF